MRHAQDARARVMQFWLAAVTSLLMLAACGGGSTPEDAQAHETEAAKRPPTSGLQLVAPPITPPALAADGTLLWSVPVGTAPVSLEVRRFATLPPTNIGTAPRLNVLAHCCGGRLFVGDETDGRIYEITGGTARLWFDVGAAIRAQTGRSLSSLTTNAHSGLRSIAFHPDFATNGLFYTSLMEQRPADTTGHFYLSDTPAHIDADSVLVEWKADPATAVPNAASYREVFRVGVPYYDHPIKQIVFGPDKLLYIAHGDGTSPSFTTGSGMRNDALGKILRIDPRASGAARYTVPTSNPFIGSTTMLPEVYSYGHRNPHHPAFTANGTLIVAEAGHDNIDEVNIVKPGSNYGWPEREGTLLHVGSLLFNGIAALPANDPQPFTYPAMQFLHQGKSGTAYTAQSIGGGYGVENGSALNGYYFATDFVLTGDVFATPLSLLTTAVTSGQPSALRTAPITKAAVLFDDDGNPKTRAKQLPNLFEMTKLSPTYDQSGRVDIRYGQGPRGELYLLSKRDRTVYLVTNSVPR